MRKRRVFISFPQQHGSDSNLLTSQKVIEGLNIGFRVKIYSNIGIPAEAYIDVYNLNREDLQFLTTSAATWMEQQTLIQLYAGYDDDVELIFGGMIEEAPPVGYPDCALKIKCLSGAEWMSKQIDVQKSNLKVIDLIDYVSSVTKCPVNIDANVRKANEALNKRLDSFSYTGSVWNLLDKIQNMVGGFSIEKGVFLGLVNDQIYVWSADNYNATGGMLKINDKSGMVGIPALTSMGVNIKMLLNTQVNTGDIVYLESERVPRATGQYRVTSIEHDGELRGKNWYTTLQCTRISPTDKVAQDDKTL